MKTITFYEEPSWWAWQLWEERNQNRMGHKVAHVPFIHPIHPNSTISRLFPRLVKVPSPLCLPCVLLNHEGLFYRRTHDLAYSCHKIPSPIFSMFMYLPKIPACRGKHAQYPWKTRQDHESESTYRRWSHWTTSLCLWNPRMLLLVRHQKVWPRHGRWSGKCL